MKLPAANMPLRLAFMIAKRSPNIFSLSIRYAAHICWITSGNPGSKIPPVTVLNCVENPSSVFFHHCSLPRSNTQSVLGSAVEKRTPPSVPRISMNHVFVDPGESLFISNLRGTSCSPTCTQVCRRALSHVSHVATPPLPSGRCDTPFCSCAKSLLGFQPSRRGRWHACMPRSFNTPPSPQVGLWRFQFAGLVGSRSLLW